MKKPDPDRMLQWCQRRLGPSRCRTIRVVDRARPEYYGWWDWDRTIWINVRWIKSRTQLYRVLAHEWTHAQQRWRDYKKGIPLGEGNPLEIEARKRERSLEFWPAGIAPHKLRK